MDVLSPWMLALRELHKHAGGVFRLAVMNEANFDQAFASMVSGEPHAVAIFTALVIAENQVKAKPPAEAMPCLACGRPVADRLRAFGVVVPDVPAPPIAVALAVCADCASGEDAVMAALTPCLRTLWPNLRQLGLTVNAIGQA